MGFAVILMDLFLQRRFGHDVKRNPWNASTLEWAMSLPAPTYNFKAIPEITTRADKLNIDAIIENMKDGQGYLLKVRHKWRETLGTDAVSGKPDYIILLPGPTCLPLYTALATGLVVLSLLFKVYWLALVGLVIVSGLMVFTGCFAGLKKDHGALDAGMKAKLPLHTEVMNSPPWLALCITLFANGTLFASLIFGVFYLWLIAPNWPPEEILNLPVIWPIVAIALMAGKAIIVRFLITASTKTPILILLFALKIVVMSILAIIAFKLPDPQTHAYSAANFVLISYVILHLFVGVLFTVSNFIRLKTGYVSPKRNLDLRLTQLWTNYTVATGTIAISIVLILPYITGGGS